MFTPFPWECVNKCFLKYLISKHVSACSSLHQSVNKCIYTFEYIHIMNNCSCGFHVSITSVVILFACVIHFDVDPFGNAIYLAEKIEKEWMEPVNWC